MPSRPPLLFEDYPGCPRPPALPVQGWRDQEALSSIGVGDSPVARAVMRTALRLCGFSRFHTALSSDPDDTLSRRAARPLNAHAPLTAAAVALADDPMAGDAFTRAARLLRAVHALHDDIRTGRFAPDRLQGRALESRGYLNLFGTSLAFDGRDFGLFKTADTASVLVLARRRMFVLTLDRPGGMSVDDLTAALRTVWHHADTGSRASARNVSVIGAATTTTQRAAYRHLLRDDGNRAAYAAALNAFVTVCLDAELAPMSHAEAAELAFIRNPANRWFASSLQIVTFANGKACLVCNFNAGLTGNIMTRTAHELCRPVRDDAHPASALAQRPAAIRELQWHVWGVDFDAVAADLRATVHSEPSTFTLDRFGRDFFADQGLPPIETFTVAAQYAAERLRGRPVTMRQFLAVSKFRCGGVQTAVVSTLETRRLLEALATAPTTAPRLFPEAVASQRQACRRVRASFQLRYALKLFQDPQRGADRAVARCLMRVAWALLRRLGRATGSGRDIVLSHPDLYEAAPIIGRPGVRTPYLTCFGLHYQIFPDRTTLTIMPGRAWGASNADLAREIRSALELIASACAVRVGAARQA